MLVKKERLSKIINRKIMANFGDLAKEKRIRTYFYWWRNCKK